jgi:hypothetical protein
VVAGELGPTCQVDALYLKVAENPAVADFSLKFTKEMTEKAEQAGLDALIKKFEMSDFERDGIKQDPDAEAAVITTAKGNPAAAVVVLQEILKEAAIAGCRPQGGRSSGAGFTQASSQGSGSRRPGFEGCRPEGREASCCGCSRPEGR